MKAIMIMFDSLNRRMLPPYGCDWVHAPNFERLAHNSVVFDNSFVGSMPCMPARRELHTGRYNFLHRSWGPMEPYDDSAIELMKNSNVATHLVSDHYHYWEEGGTNYHTKYSNWEISRGQEGDPWKGQLADPDIPQPNKNGRGDWARQDWINRSYMQDEIDQPQAKTFGLGAEFIETNHAEDNWFLHIETFDPHEPYFSHNDYKKLYDYNFDLHEDWPPYSPTGENDELTESYRYSNAALVSMCDAYLGKILDQMDAHDMWKDTLLIVNTDHGFLLGEHDWWGKCSMPFYNEIARTPMFIWDPRSGVAGERRKNIVQTIDLPATLLDFFKLPIPDSMQGKPLTETIKKDAAVRETALYGIHGGHVNVTDGKYVYMRAPHTADNAPLFNYTLMPSHMRESFSIDELRTAEMSKPFPFTKGCSLMRIRADRGIASNAHNFGNLLFDMENDPDQLHPLNDPEIEKKMSNLMILAMKMNDAPKEQFERLGLEI